MKTNQPTEQKICSICNDLYEGYGNNAWPINSGRCCDSCNNLVVSHRIKNFQRGLNAYAEPQWFKDLRDEIVKSREEDEQATPKGWESV